MPTKIRRSSGNVFRDLGFTPAESANLRLRSDLMTELGKVIKRRRLHQRVVLELGCCSVTNSRNIVPHGFPGAPAVIGSVRSRLSAFTSS